VIDIDALCLTRAGEVDRHNHARLGYERLTWGVYGRAPDVEGLDPAEARRQQFLVHLHAVMTAYQKGDVAVFGATALQALGVELPASLEDWDKIHVLVRSGRTRPSRRGVVAHRATDFTVVRTNDGLPLLHPVDHWTQLGAASPDELIQVGDALVRRQKPLLTLNQIRRRLGELAGTRGVRPIRQAFRWVMPGTGSLYETQARLLMIRAGLPVPAVNFPVKIKATGATYRLNMSYPYERVGVELDIVDPAADPKQRDADAARRHDLEDEGWLIFLVTPDQLGDPVQFLRSIEQALILRRASLAKMLPAKRAVNASTKWAL
jgi:hypothetical protein